MDVITKFIDYATQLIASGGLVVGFILIVIESFIPILPLAVFVALNINAFGFFVGTCLSWIATCIGCYICYLLFYYLSDKITYKLLSNKTKERIQKGLKKFQNISLQGIVLIITLPFTPAFLINILAGIAKVRHEKFLLAILIGKVFMVIFWGYIGKSFIESISDIRAILYIIVTLGIAYVISKIVGKKMNIE